MTGLADASTHGTPPPAEAGEPMRGHGGVQGLRQALSRTDRRWLLWSALVVLVALALGILVWLARGHELEQLQRALDRDNAQAVLDIRSDLTRNVQDLHALPAGHVDPAAWSQAAATLLRAHREWLRLEWRDAARRRVAVADSPYEAPLIDGEAGAPAEVLQACALAQKLGGPAYAPSRFVPVSGGYGHEVLALCVPLTHLGQRSGYVVAEYALSGVLTHLLSEQYTRRQEVSLTEPDGTRLAVHGAVRRGSRIFTSQQLLDLPGVTLVLRMDGWRAAPDVFPNVLTALVTGLTIALITVLTLLWRDFQRRQRAEADLADALAFRKAMEDSLVTGLRARDLQGRITYVNPAFCALTGFAADELIGHGAPAPYWPPEMAHEYGQRQAVRLAGNLPPREGVESVFQRKDGVRVPVLIIEAPLINALGKHAGWMSAVLDLSEQRRIEELSRASAERLQATARLATVGEMASLLSHELNQPLAAISGYATGSMNLLHDPGTPPDHATLADLRAALARIAEQAGRAGKVINSVHDFVRRREQAREAVAPHALFDAVMPLVQLQARKLGITVHTDAPRDLPAVWCDRTMVEQVLLNLARNGMQAMASTPAPERVLRLWARPCSARGERTWLEFGVADAGTGIDADVARQLFTPFFTTKAEGMGLGLSLCRTVIEQHGGALDHGANTPRGTVFRFTLRAAAVP